MLSTERRLLNIDQAATYLQISKSYLYKIVEAGGKSKRGITIPFVRLGRRVLFDVKDLDRLIEKNKKRPKEWVLRI